MKRLLVPIDLAHESSAKLALPIAFDLARALGGEVLLLTVVPEIPAGLDLRYAIRGETGGSAELDIDLLLGRASDRLAEIGKAHAKADESFDVHARYGVVYEEILDLAEELDVDQIVMTAHRPSVSERLLGTNAARVVRHAKCSVQVVREGL